MTITREEAKERIQIKHRYSLEVLFECDAPTLRGALEEASKRGADLEGAYLEGADLRGAYLRCANLEGAYLRGAYLRCADLRCANLEGAYLRGAYLGGAYLRGAYLGGANLEGANLRGADLRGAYLRCANLEGADLRGADLRGAQGLIPARCTPLLILREQPGQIRAYKLVMASGEGPINGGITYRVGETVEQADADTDENTDCGVGIHVATLDWCLSRWQPGYRILVVEFTAGDIAAIPTGTDGKFRLFRCKVVREIDLRKELDWPPLKEEGKV